MIEHSTARCSVRPLGEVAAWLIAILLLASSQAVHGTALTWQERPLPLPDIRFEQVAGSGTALLARGRDIDAPFGPGLLFVSDNGVDWRPIDPGLAGRGIDAIGFALDRFIVVLDDGRLLVGSDDATSWSTLPGPVDQRLVVNTVIEHDGRAWFLARWRRVNSIGIDAVGLVSSVDFSVWTTAYRTEFDGPVFVPSLAGLAAGAETFATTRTAPPPTVSFGAAFAMSSDGADWLGSGGAGPFVRSGGVAWNGSAFIALASGPTDGSSAPLRLVRRTPDGDFDIVEHPDRIGVFRTLRGGPDGIILQRLDSGANGLLTSADGTEWLVQPVAPTGTFQDFVRWQGGWVGVGTTTIRGVPQRALPVPTLSSGGLMVLTIGLVLAGAFAATRKASRERNRP